MQSKDKRFEDLVIDYFSGDISSEKLKEFSDLIKTSDDYKNRFDELCRLHAISFTPILESEKQANYQSILDRINTNTTPHYFRLWNSTFRNIAAAIILIISVSIATFYIYRDISSKADNLICYETISPKGSQTKVILPDSTVVWLNSGSSLKYSKAFGKHNREVELSGEGYFEVTKHTEKKFIVHTEKLNINDVGTIFNVKAYKNEKEIIVNLIEGIVDVSLLESKNKILCKMNPNEELVFDKLNGKSKLTKTDSSRSAQWINSKLCFVDASIEQIARDLERKYKVKIEIASNKIRTELFSGSLDLNLSLKDVLSYIDVDKKMIITQKADTIYINMK